MLYVITPLLAFGNCLPKFLVPIYDCCEGCSFRCRGEFRLLLLQSTMQPMQVCWQWGCWGWQMQIYSQGTAFICLQIYSQSLTQKPLMWHGTVDLQDEPISRRHQEKCIEQGRKVRKGWLGFAVNQSTTKNHESSQESKVTPLWHFYFESPRGCRVSSQDLVTHTFCEAAGRFLRLSILFGTGNYWNCLFSTVLESYVLS